MIWIRRFVILPPVLLGFAMIWQALAIQPDPPTIAAQEVRVPVAFVEATPRRFVPHVSGYGTVEPARVWTAVAQVSGRIGYLHPSLARGGVVDAGDVLIQISPQDYELALERASADLIGAEAQIQELQVSRQSTEASLSIEQESLTLIQADLVRSEQLAKKGVVSDQVAQAQRRDVLAQRLKVQSLENTLALMPSQIKALEQSAAVARLAKRSAELDLQRTIITAPFDARVANVDVEVSQFVGTGTVMSTLDEVAAPEVDVQISQRRMTALAQLMTQASSALSHSGRPVSTVALRGDTALHGSLAPSDPRRLSAEIRLVADQGAYQWRADVVRISDSVSAETRSVGVIVRAGEPLDTSLPAARPALMKGMFVKVGLKAPPVDGVILVPRSAVRDGRVMVVGRDNRLAFAKVAVVFSADDVAVLAAGSLDAKTRIITSQPSPAIQGLLLAPQPDQRVDARLTAYGKEISP